MFELTHVNGEIERSTSWPEFVTAKEARNKEIVNILKKRLKPWKEKMETNEGVEYIDYKNFTILIIYGTCNDTFGLILRGETPITVLDLKMYAEETICEGIIKINNILGKDPSDFELEPLQE